MDDDLTATVHSALTALDPAKKAQFRENSNKVKQEQGALSVARIKAQTANTQADSEVYRVIAAAKAQAEKTRIDAEAQAQATRLAAKAAADAIRSKADADSQVMDAFAREM